MPDARLGAITAAAMSMLLAYKKILGPETTTADLQAKFEEAVALSRRKNSDYAGAGVEADPFANFRMVYFDYGMPVDIGILVRLSDKFNRVLNLLVQTAQVLDERIEDTCLDALNYLGILYAWVDLGEPDAPHVEGEHVCEHCDHTQPAAEAEQIQEILGDA